MNIEDTKKAIAVMQAFVDGKTILNSVGDVVLTPAWTWTGGLDNYKVAPPKPMFRVAYRQGGYTLAVKNGGFASYDDHCKFVEGVVQQGTARWVTEWTPISK